MFGIIDYIVTAGIKQKLEFLSKNPHHIYHIFGGFLCNPNIKDVVGEKYIKEVVEYLITHRMQVAPAYNIDQNKNPSLAIISSGEESQQYIGDYGASSFHKTSEPFVYDRFDATSIRVLDNNTLTTSIQYNLLDKIWKGIFVGNGIFSAQLDYAYNDEAANATVLVLKSEIPEGTSLKNWVTSSDDQYRGVIYSASTDDITTSITLTTSGAYSQHYLYSTLVRAVLKSQRMFFDANGFQVATMGYSIPVIADQEDLIFQTQFTLKGKFTESWIDKEFDLPNKGGKYDFCVSVKSNNPNNQVVVLPEDLENETSGI
jgi:hypothetical protein